MFNLFKSKATGAVKRFSGRTDLLEAMCAHIALAAAADGSVEDDEVEAGLQVAKDNETLSSSFSDSEIETCLEKKLRQTKSFTGKAALRKELDDCKNHPEDEREAVWLAGVDAAVTGDGIGAAEKKLLDETAKILKINPGKFGL